MPNAIIVHGGAGTTAEAVRPGHEAGIRAALDAGRRVLAGGGSALDAVVESVALMEDLPVFNAGYGSVLNCEGFVELDAGLMDGDDLELGCVASVRDIGNPVRLCRHVLQSPEIFFTGEAASRLAERHGLDRLEPSDLITPGRRRSWESGTPASALDTGAGDTVGAVALDQKGGLAAATSTGGTGGKPVGRVGDSPLPGGGFFADSEAGAASTTGWGEGLARILAARRAVETLGRGHSSQQAAAAVIEYLERRIPGGLGGVIVLDDTGRIGRAHNTSSMTHAWWVEGGDQGLAV